jgi:hypothetical protein
MLDHWAIALGEPQDVVNVTELVSRHPIPVELAAASDLGDDRGNRIAVASVKDFSPGLDPTVLSLPFARHLR